MSSVGVERAGDVSIRVGKEDEIRGYDVDLAAPEGTYSEPMTVRNDRSAPKFVLRSEEIDRVRGGVCLEVKKRSIVDYLVSKITHALETVPQTDVKELMTADWSVSGSGFLNIPLEELANIGGEAGTGLSVDVFHLYDDRPREQQPFDSDTQNDGFSGRDEFVLSVLRMVDEKIVKYLADCSWASRRRRGVPNVSSYLYCCYYFNRDGLTCKLGRHEIPTTDDPKRHYGSAGGLHDDHCFHDTPVIQEWHRLAEVAEGRGW